MDNLTATALNSMIHERFESWNTQDALVEKIVKVLCRGCTEEDSKDQVFSRRIFNLIIMDVLLTAGAVIPANIEAPLDTIKQANEEAILNVFSKLGISTGNNRNSGNETFVFQVDGSTFFEITRKYADEYFASTGRSPFPI